MGLVPALSISLLIVSINIAAAAHVPNSSSATELVFRGRIHKRTMQKDQQITFLDLLPRFVQAAPRRHSNVNMSKYLAASMYVGELIPSSFAVSLATVDNPAESDEKMGRGDSFLGNRMAQIIYFSGLVIVLCLVCWMYKERGIWVTVSVVCYLFSLSSMTLSIRNVYVNCDFEYPQFLTATHLFFTGLVGLCILKYQQQSGGDPISVPRWDVFAKGIFPVSVTLTFSIGSANLGLLYTNAHFYEMVGATTALVTAGVGTVFGKKFNFQLLPPLLAVTGGLMICALGEVAFSSVGFAFCVTAVTCRAVKAIIQHQLMAGDLGSQIKPMQLVVWVSWPSFGIMAVWSLYSEGLHPFVQVVENFSTVGAVALTIVNACVLNTAAMYALHNLGPVSQQLAGCLKGVLSIFGSVALFGEHVTIQQIVGYSFIVCGVAWYNRKENQIKQLKKDVGDGAPANLHAKVEETLPGNAK